MRMKMRAIGAFLFGVLALIGGPVRSADLEQPAYTVASTEENFEVRDYAAMVVAQFTMRGTYNRSVSDGYIKLERYFLGDNDVPEAIAYTVPVMVRDDQAAGWTTMFYLPRIYRQDTAPLPTDRRIRVVEMPARRAAAIKFKGKLNEAVMRDEVAALSAWLSAHGLDHRGDFTLAGYSQSWVPGNWRENEVIVTLK